MRGAGKDAGRYSLRLRLGERFSLCRHLLDRQMFPLEGGTFGERIYCRGTLGRAKVFSWSEVRTAKMQFEYVRVCGEVMVQFDDTKGRSVRFPIPALYADEVGALIKSHPKVIFNSTQNKSSMNFKI